MLDRRKRDVRLKWASRTAQEIRDQGHGRGDCLCRTGVTEGSSGGVRFAGPHLYPHRGDAISTGTCVDRRRATALKVTRLSGPERVVISRSAPTSARMGDALARNLVSTGFADPTHRFTAAIHNRRQFSRSAICRRQALGHRPFYIIESFWTPGLRYLQDRSSRRTRELALAELDRGGYTKGRKRRQPGYRNTPKQPPRGRYTKLAER